MLWKRRDAAERIFIKNRKRNMLWKRRDASEGIFINVGKELDKKDALGEEGCYRDDFRQL